MLRFVLDEHIPSALESGLRLRGLDIVRVQDVGLRTAGDPAVFDWAAQDGRVVLSEDRNTMIAEANDRIAAGRPFAGLVVLARTASVGRIVDDVHVVAGVYTPAEVAAFVVHLPL